MSNLVKALAVFSALLPVCAFGQQQVIVYDNSTTDLNQTYFGGTGVEFGDQIVLGGSERTIVDFKFEYFLGGATPSGNENLQLVIRANDGPTISVPTPGGGTAVVATPGTVLYTSPVLSMQSGFNTAEASGFSFNAPNTFTWTVTMTGIDPGEAAGLILRDPPTVGSSFADFWQNNGGTWNTYLLDNGNTPANFAARVSAVPEPTTFASILLAGLAGLGYVGYRRRNS